MYKFAEKKGMSVLMEVAFGKIGYISFICGFKRLSRPIVWLNDSKESCTNKENGVLSLAQFCCHTESDKWKDNKSKSM